ncbi:MAG TPA: hypothetical protein VMF69_20770 [Gemmataceae bacterium]|nr:hypothetical protein [Gemmataceae bacterium]
MRPDDIRRLLRQKPFQPFRLYLVDGSSYEIRHPDQVMVERSTAAIAGAVANLPPPLAERDVIVALLHISRLEPIESVAPRPSDA